MRLLVVLLVSALLSPSPQAQPDISGAWAVTVVDFGVPSTMRLVLKHVADLVGTQVSIAAKLPKSALAKLRKSA